MRFLYSLLTLGTLAVGASAQLLPARMGGSGGYSSPDVSRLAHGDDKYINFMYGGENDVAYPTITATFQAFAPGNDYDLIAFTCESALESRMNGVDPYLTERVEMYSWYHRSWVTVKVMEGITLDFDETLVVSVPVRSYIHPLSGEVAVRVRWTSEFCEISNARVDQAFWSFQ